jgi:hypothetical protein
VSTPITTGADLAEHLGGNPDAALCDLAAAAANAALSAIVDEPVDPDPWADELVYVATVVGGDAYKAASGTGGGYQLDAVTFTDQFRVTSTLMRRYEPILAKYRKIGGMIG